MEGRSNDHRSLNQLDFVVVTWWETSGMRLPDAYDVSTFFRNKRGRDREFQSFWQGKNNKSRRAFEKQWKEAVTALKEEL